jgi:C4-dicarboxylate-specific signal transduction histidine kinase
MRPESLEHVVREAVQLVLFGTAQFDIRLTYRLDPAADLIFADRIQVQQVLVNLLRNAVDALRGQPAKKREIYIASRAVAEDMTEISVSDNGPGLPEARVASPMRTPTRASALTDRTSAGTHLLEQARQELQQPNRPHVRQPERKEKRRWRL